MKNCKSIGCSNSVGIESDFCPSCSNKPLFGFGPDDSLSDRYPDTYKSVGDVTEIDTFAVHQMFQIKDHSGCLQSASQKLLMSGSSKTTYRDICEARDTLTRWLQLNQELNT